MSSTCICSRSETLLENHCTGHAKHIEKDAFAQHPPGPFTKVSVMVMLRSPTDGHAAPRSISVLLDADVQLPCSWSSWSALCCNLDGSNQGCDLFPCDHCLARHRVPRCLQPLEDAIDFHWPFHRHRSHNPQTLKHVDHHTDRACRTDQSGSLCCHRRVHEVIRQHKACTEQSAPTQHATHWRWQQKPTDAHRMLGSHGHSFAYVGLLFPQPPYNNCMCAETVFEVPFRNRIAAPTKTRIRHTIQPITDHALHPVHFEPAQ